MFYLVKGRESSKIYHTPPSVILFTYVTHYPFLRSVTPVTVLTFKIRSLNRSRVTLESELPPLLYRIQYKRLFLLNIPLVHIMFGKVLLFYILCRSLGYTALKLFVYLLTSSTLSSSLTSVDHFPESGNISSKSRSRGAYKT